MVSVPASATHLTTSFQHAVRLRIDSRLMDVVVLSHRPKLPDMDLHDWMIQLRPTSRQVDRIVAYVLSDVISWTPVDQSVSLVVSINAVHAVIMSLHIAFTVRSAATPNTDNARESNSVMESIAESRHWDVRVVIRIE